jgi:hypothetical protein
MEATHMGRTARITIVVAPFAFAVLPLAALLMPTGGPGPGDATPQVRTAEPKLPRASEGASEAAYHAGADCPLGAGGI